ncbi:MAG TPA: ABC transporter substrate-binding protein [Streptosporangiaceae bacterium]
MRRSIRRSLSSVIMVVALSVTACGSVTSTTSSTAGAPGGTFPAVVHAVNGTVRLPKRPVAILSLSPTATEMLYAVGAGRQVKAVDKNSDYPPQAHRTAMSGYAPNVEAIAGLRPDLVVTDSGTGGLTGKLAALHIPVLVLPPAARLADVYQQLDELGMATGHLSQARQEDEEIRTQIASIVASVPKHPEPVTYYYELEQDYYSVTSSTFVGQLLQLLGLKSIADAAPGAASAGGYPQLSAEYILKSNPGYIFLADTICCGQNATTVAARPGWASLTAVRDGHVVGLNDDVASRWGPRIVDLLRAVARALGGHG